jgi:hypothetical protein
LGEAFEEHPTSLGNPTTTKFICQFGEVFLNHAENPIFGIHLGLMVCSVGSNKHEIHPQLVGLKDTK